MTRLRSLLLLLLFPFCTLIAQKTDTAWLSSAAQLFDLSLTPSEKDSMVDGVSDNQRIYRKMHQQSLTNSQPWSLGFHPAPPGYPIPVKQLPVSWNLPAASLPANRNELAFYTVAELASLVKNKKISSVDLTRFFLDRLKKWGDTLQCVITITEDLALQQARQADEEIKKGIYRGPLHGIPYGLKDLFAVKGYKTTWGAAPYKDQVIDEDAFVYGQLKKAGAVLCAKLTLGALASGDNWYGGKTRNPWNTALGSSGSSAGPAAAVSAGLLPFAIGTETWGSIISPSHTCGVTGLRPTFGSVSRSGAMVLSWSLDKIGPICRSAEDDAIVFYYIKGADGKDGDAVNRAFNYTGKPNWKKLRIAYAANYFKPIPKTMEHWAVIETLKKAGADIKEVDFPDSTLYPFNIMRIIIGSETAAAFDPMTRSHLDDSMTWQRKVDWPNGFRVSRMIPAVEYVNASRYRYALMTGLNDFMKQYDVIIVPSFAGNQGAMTNLTGHPAVCVPIGMNANGRPNSITLIGNLYDEATILAVAKAYQDASGFVKRHPGKFSN